MIINKEVERMSYVVFDLDQTLADVTIVYLFLLTLTLRHYIEVDKPYLLAYFSNEFEAQLKKAYQLFVKYITIEEMSDHPLGILRPGILTIMKQIHKLRRVVKDVTIYSNNRYLPSLLLVKDVIHCALGHSLIGSCIHWDHPSRKADHSTQPYITKSWNTLKEALIDQGALPDLLPDRVLFFDDQDHVQLQSILQTQYYKVPVYQTHDTFDRIATIYIRCLEEANVNMYSVYSYLGEIMDEEMTHYDPSHFMMSDLIHLIQKGSRHTYPTKPPIPDHGIRMMRHALQDMKIKEQVIRGGKRRTRRNHRRTIKK